MSFASAQRLYDMQSDDNGLGYDPDQGDPNYNAYEAEDEEESIKIMEYLERLFN
jgi:hypothetical protein